MGENSPRSALSKNVELNSANNLNEPGRGVFPEPPDTDTDRLLPRLHFWDLSVEHGRACLDLAPKNSELDVI